jgi:hypothetical protein
VIFVMMLFSLSRVYVFHRESCINCLGLFHEGLNILIIQEGDILLITFDML